MMKFLVFLALLASNLALAQLPALNSRSYLLLDFQSRQVLAARNPDLRVEPASLTKLLTAYVVFDALRQKRITLAQPFSVSEKAWHAPGSRMFLTVAESVTVEELLNGMIVQSGNDAAITLAEGVAGSEDAFVEIMNREAQRLGMTHSHFVNAT
ncbi:MAG TPA: serine hydrolase, partial [Burkholderiales bacterium]